MRISLRLSLIVGVALVVGFGATFAAAAGIILDDQRQLEEQEAARVLDRVESRLQADEQDLLASATEMIQIMQVLAAGNGFNDTEQDESQYAPLAIALFSASDLDFLAFEGIDPTTGQTFQMSITVDRTTGAFGVLPSETNASLFHSSIFRIEDGLDERAGIEDLAGVPYLLAAKPMLFPQAVETVLGAIAVGRAVDSHYVQAVDPGSQLRFTDSLDEPRFDRAGFGTLHASRVLTGVDGVPIMTMVITTDREAFQSGLTTLALFSGGAVLASVVIVAGTIFLMRHAVTDRIGRLAHGMRRIRKGGDGWVDVGGDDEITQLAREFRHLMGVVDQRTADLDRFAGIVSHDLQSPMSTFSLNLGMMQRSIQDPKEQERIARMRRTAEHISERIRALLEQARQQAPAGRQPIALDTIVQGVLADMDADLQAADARVDISPLPTVLGDPQQLAQVFQNLVQNAVKYRQEGQPARLQIRARRSGDRWLVRVRDQGRGFEQSQASKMLRPFQRLDNTGSAHGHGVGLSICADIVERHGGHLRATGRPGQGAAFTFDLGAA